MLPLGIRGLEEDLHVNYNAETAADVESAKDGEHDSRDITRI